MACISYITYRRGQRKRRYLFNLEYICGILQVKRKRRIANKEKSCVIYPSSYLTQKWKRKI